MRKLIALLMIMASGTFAANDNFPVTYNTNTSAMAYSSDGSNVTPFASGITNYFVPSFGMLASTSSPFRVAASVAVTNGTISSGSVTNTWFEDQDYLVLDESGVWEETFTFQDSGLPPRIVNFHGRYEGLPAHNVKFSAYDYTNAVFTNLTAATDDLPSSTTDSSMQFVFPAPNENFTDTNGNSIVKIYHVGAAVGTHQLFTDFIQITYATDVSENAGIWYPLAGFPIAQQFNIDATTSNITTTSSGIYTWQWSLSFTGSTSTQFRIRHTTNGVYNGTQSIRSIGGEPSVGSMSGLGGGRLASGITNAWEWSADTDGAYIAVVNGSAQVRKESN